MKPLIKPERLRPGDTVATISISGGRAGDADMLWRYELGKKRLEDIFGLRVVETPHGLRGSRYLYENPQARAEDLHWALENPAVKGIVANMGGDDSYRLLPYLDYELIRSHPKIYMGFSDITTTCCCFARAGVMSYYGPSLLTPIAQPGRLDEYTENAIRRTLFSGETVGPVEPCKRHTPIEWQDKAEREIVWQENQGYQLIQGHGKVRGRLIGGCLGPLQQIMGTEAFPSRESWEGSLLFIENFAPYGSRLAELHGWRALAACGALEKCSGLITPAMSQEGMEILRRVLKYEVGREDLPVLANVDFGHRTPMTVLPVGALAEIDCEAAAFTILESGAGAAQDSVPL